MPFALRNLHLFKKYRVGVQAKCGTCDGRWDLDLSRAITALGGEARPNLIIGRAKCPRCCDGRAADWVPTIPTQAMKNPVWFATLFNDYNDDH